VSKTHESCKTFASILVFSFLCFSGSTSASSMRENEMCLSNGFEVIGIAKSKEEAFLLSLDRATLLESFYSEFEKHQSSSMKFNVSHQMIGYFMMRKYNRQLADHESIIGEPVIEQTHLDENILNSINNENAELFGTLISSDELLAAKAVTTKGFNFELLVPFMIDALHTTKVFESAISANKATDELVYLAEMMPDKNVVSNTFETILNISVRYGRFDLAKALISMGVSYKANYGSFVQGLLSHAESARAEDIWSIILHYNSYGNELSELDFRRAVNKLGYSNVVDKLVIESSSDRASIDEIISLNMNWTGYIVEKSNVCSEVEANVMTDMELSSLFEKVEEQSDLFQERLNALAGYLPVYTELYINSIEHTRTVDSIAIDRELAILISEAIVNKDQNLYIDHWNGAENDSQKRAFVVQSFFSGVDADWLNEIIDNQGFSFPELLIFSARFDYPIFLTRKILSRENLRKLDSSGRDLLSIASMHGSEGFILEIIENHPNLIGDYISRLAPHELYSYYYLSKELSGSQFVYQELKQLN